MTEDQIKYMVQRFLAWKLPESFRPDAGISFKAEFNDSPAVMAALGIDKPMRHEPMGTNLFDATQAEAMIRHMLDGVPQEAAMTTPPALPEPQRHVDPRDRPDRYRDSYDPDASWLEQGRGPPGHNY